MYIILKRQSTFESRFTGKSNITFEPTCLWNGLALIHTLANPQHLYTTRKEAEDVAANTMKQMIKDGMEPKEASSAFKIEKYGELETKSVSEPPKGEDEIVYDIP